MLDTLLDTPETTFEPPVDHGDDQDARFKPSLDPDVAEQYDELKKRVTDKYLAPRGLSMGMIDGGNRSLADQTKYQAAGGVAAAPGKSLHQYGKALDFTFFDQDGNRVPDVALKQQVGAEAESLGFRSGHRFNDPGHLEWNPARTLKDMQPGFQLDPTALAKYQKSGYIHVRDDSTDEPQGDYAPGQKIDPAELKKMVDSGQAAIDDSAPPDLSNLKPGDKLTPDQMKQYSAAGHIAVDDTPDPAEPWRVPSIDPKFSGAIAQQRAQQKPVTTAPQPNVPSYQQVTPELINKAMNQTSDAQAATEFAQRNQVADALQGFVDKQDRMNNLMAKQTQAGRAQGNPRGAALGTVPRTTMTTAEAQELQGLQSERDTLIQRARQKAEAQRPDDLASVAKANGTAREAALGAFVQKHGALTRDEQRSLGLPTNYLTNLSMNAATGTAQFAVNTAAGFERLVGSPANARDLQRLSQQMGTAEGVYGNPDLPGAVAHSVGALAPQVALSAVLPESALADPLFFAGSTALEHYGTGATGAESLEAGLGALTPIVGAKVIGGLAVGGKLAQGAQRVVGNAAFNGLMTAAQGGNQNAVITAGLLGAFMGIGGHGNEPIDPDVIRRGIVDDGLREAVTEHIKNPSAETFDNIAKTAEKAGLDAYEAQKFATNVDSLKSASPTTPEVTNGVTQENTTTPISPIERDENGLPIRRIAPIPEHPIGETAAPASIEQVKPDAVNQPPLDYDQIARSLVDKYGTMDPRRLAMHLGVTEGIASNILDRINQEPSSITEGQVKQPWQMTRSEFSRGDRDTEHKASVAQAVADGKEVSSDVLSDYPDIRDKYWAGEDAKREEAKSKTAALLREGKPEQVTQKDFLDYHRTGRIADSAYKGRRSIEDFASIGTKEDYPNLISSRKVDGETIEYRRHGERLKYVKTDANGEIIRDENHLATYLSPEEMKAKNLPLTSTYTVAFNEKGQPIGDASDEFGADGVWVAEPYRSKGVGTDLLREFRKQFEGDRQIGQMTSSGQSMTKSYHKSLVADALREDKPVPPEVLADYPDLQKKAETKTPVSETKPAETGTTAPEKAAKPEEFGASNKKFTKSGVQSALELIRQKQLERSKANEPTESSQVNPDVAERFKPLETEVVKTDSVLRPKIIAAIDDPSPANTKALHDAASAQLESVIPDPDVREQHARAIVDAATEESRTGRAEERGVESKPKSTDLKFVQPKSVDSPGHGMMEGAKRAKAVAKRQVDTLQARLGKATARDDKGSIRMDLTVARGKLQEARTMEADARAKIESDANRQGLTTKRPKPPKGEYEDRSIAEFVRSKGGFKDDSDLQGEVDRLRKKESGTTGLYSKNGLSPDYMREAAIEAGYLPEDGTIDDLMSAVEDDIAGKKTYSIHRDQNIIDKELDKSYERLQQSENPSEAFQRESKIVETELADPESELHKAFASAVENGDARLRDTAARFGIRPETIENLVQGAVSLKENGVNPADIQESGGQERTATPEQIPPELTRLADKIKGKGYEAAKRIVANQVGSVKSGEKFSDDVADAIFGKLQRVSQRSPYATEADIQKLGRGAERLTGKEPMTVYRGTGRANLRPGDFVADTANEAGYYTHGGKKVQKFAFPREDFIEVRGSSGGGKEYVYLPKDYEPPTPVEHYGSFKEFYDAANKPTGAPADFQADIKRAEAAGKLETEKNAAKAKAENQKELLRIGMKSGRGNIEEQQRPVSKDTLTPDLFNPQEDLLADQRKGFGDKNTLFTREDADAGIDLLKHPDPNKLRSGPIGDEEFRAMLNVAGFYVEGGVRAFADFSREMVTTIGDHVKPYLRELFERAHEEIGERPPTEVGIKNAVTNAETDAAGKPRIDVSDQKRSFDQVVEAGKAAVDDGRINPGQLAERIAAKPRPLTPEETAALLFHKTQLLNHEDSIMKELRGHRETGDVDAEIDARGRLQAVQESLDTARVASRKSGYEQGLGLAIRRAMMERDYSLSRMIERAEAANKGKPLSDAQKVDLEKLRDTIMQREEQYKDYDERQSKGEASKTITELRKEASAERKAGRTVKRSTLDGEFASQKNALAKLFSRDPNGPGKGLGGREAGAVDPELLGLPVEALKILRDMARNRLEAGLTSVDGVVDSIHEAVADVMGGVTKRQIRDLISGYGKTSKPNPEALAVAMRELTAGMRDVSAEEDILGGKAPERSGYQRGPMTPEARARRQRINQLMREHGIEIERSGRSPEEQQKSALDGVKTRLKNAIEDLQRQIDTGEKPSKRTPVPRDEEARALQAKRDDLARTLQDINGPRKMTDAQRLDMAKGAARKAIDEYQRRIDQKDFATKQSGKVSDPELDALKAKRDALKTDYQKLADADPAVQAKRDAAKLDQLKTRMQKRLDSLKQQVATGNFYRNAQGKLTTSKPRVPFAGLDPEAQEIKANVEKAQSAADAKIKAIELANRSAPEKIMDGLAKIRRFIVLSSGTAVEKLTAAGATRQISDPIEAGIGGAISKTPGLRDIAAKAPREGAFKPSVEAQASALYIKKMLDLSRFKETLKTGKGKLDLIHGGKEYFDSDSKTDRILGFYNRLHATLKEPVKEAEFFRSTQYRTDQAIRQGLDITDAKVRDNIAAQAYLDANRKVFMNPNFVTDAYTGAINKLQSSDRLDAKAMATVMKVFFPVVRVPTNYLAETASYSPIGFAKAGTTLLRKGIADLKPEDADYVMRNLKKGLIGTAAMGIGAGLSQNFGGFYTQGNYSTPQDMKAGEIKIFGVNVPRLFLHHPLIEAMQFGATFAHLRGDKQEGKLSSLFDTSLALSEEQPFIGETIRNVEAVTDKTKRAPAAGQLVGGLVTPPDLRRIANILDPKTPTSVMMKLLQTGGLQSADPMYRPPKTFAQGFESGLPSFIPYVNRKNIPSKLIPPSRPVRPEKPSR